MIPSFSKAIPELKSITAFREIILNTLASPTVEPAYATYSKTSNDKEIDVHLFIKRIQEESDQLEPIIDSIEDLDIDEKSKKEIIAILYLLFGDKDRAIKLIN